MHHIDGAAGEGGGQILRTALGLSVATGVPVTIDRIRQRRRQPGLQRQHLTAVLAAQQVGGARVVGAELGSPRLEFWPGAPSAGTFHFAIGTAGSTALVLQAVLPALWAAGAASTLVLEGGTHNPLAPPFEFLARAFAPLLARLGAPLELELVRPGFFPAGGGCVRARVAPPRWQRLDLGAGEPPTVYSAQILDCGLPRHVAERQAEVLRTQLPLPPERVQIERRDAHGPGNAVLVQVASGDVVEVLVELAERGRTAEAVAERAVRAVRRHLGQGVPVGEHLADQLLVPMALAGGGSFVTCAPTEHLRTNARVVETFLPVAIRCAARGAAWQVTVAPR
jgi:RNA 3'-terminal phosphate cyclase (ATP)